MYAIRLTVFVDEQKVPAAEELDSYDDAAIHFLAYSQEGAAIGTARLLDKGNEHGKVGRVAVLPAYRGKGAGGGLMYMVESTAVDMGMKHLELDAQLHAIPFYENLGYTGEGDIFLDAGIEHRKMRKLLI